MRNHGLPRKILLILSNFFLRLYFAPYTNTCYLAVLQGVGGGAVAAMEQVEVLIEVDAESGPRTVLSAAGGSGRLSARGLV